MSEDVEKLVMQVANSIGNLRIPELIENLIRDKGLKYSPKPSKPMVLGHNSTSHVDHLHRVPCGGSSTNLHALCFRLAPPMECNLGISLSVEPREA